MKLNIKDKNYTATFSIGRIKLNNNIVIGCDVGQSVKVVINSKENCNIHLHDKVITGIGFVEDVVVFTDVENDLYKIDPNDHTKSVEITTMGYGNIEHVMSAGNQTMFMCRNDKHKTYYKVIKDEGLITTEAINRTKYERLANKAVFLDKFMDDNNIIVELR